MDAVVSQGKIGAATWGAVNMVALQHLLLLAHVLAILSGLIVVGVAFRAYIRERAIFLIYTLLGFGALVAGITMQLILYHLGLHMIVAKIIEAGLFTVGFILLYLSFHR